MYELLLKGTNKTVQISSAQKLAIEQKMSDPTLGPDHAIKIDSDTTIKKGDIKGIFRSENRVTKDANEYIRRIQLQHELDQLSEVIKLKDTPSHERTNLSYLKTAVFAVRLSPMTESEFEVIRNIERDYFVQNPDHVIYYDAKQIEQLYPSDKPVVRNSITEHYSAIIERIVSGYLSDIKKWQAYNAKGLRTMWNNIYVEFKSIDGKDEDLRVLHTR